MNTLGMRLKMARKAAGLSLRKVGELIGLSHAAIKKYEDGKAFPSSDILLKLAQAFSIRSEYFFRPIKHRLEKVKFRKRRSIQKKVEESIRQEVLDQIERRLELEDLFPTPHIANFTVPSLSIKKIDNLNQLEDLANHIRKEWELGNSPIHNLIDVLESHGIPVFIIKHEVKDFDGLSAQTNEREIIVIGSHSSGDRQRFTLAHELGHLIIQRLLSNHINEEDACNRFAGAFLLPKEAVFHEIGKVRHSIELRELELLKEEYGISMAAICHRLKDLQVITERYFKSLMLLFKKKGWNIHEPGKTLPPEESHIFEQMIFHALAESYIGESKAAELLNTSLEDFKAKRLLESSYAAID